MMKIKKPFLPGVPERLRQAHMDVRVPFQVPAESVDGGDEAGDADALYVPEKVRAVLFPVELSAVLVFQPLVEGLVGGLVYRVPRGGEEKAQAGPVVDHEKGAVLLRDGEDDVAVPCVDGQRFCVGSPELLRLDAAGGAEEGMAFVVKNVPVAAPGAEEFVISQP